MRVRVIRHKVDSTEETYYGVKVSVSDGRIRVPLRNNYGITKQYSGAANGQHFNVRFTVSEVVCSVGKIDAPVVTENY